MAATKFVAMLVLASVLLAMAPGADAASRRLLTDQGCTVDYPHANHVPIVGGLLGLTQVTALVCSNEVTVIGGDVKVIDGDVSNLVNVCNNGCCIPVNAVNLALLNFLGGNQINKC